MDNNYCSGKSLKIIIASVIIVTLVVSISIISISNPWGHNCEAISTIPSSGTQDVWSSNGLVHVKFEGFFESKVDQGPNIYYPLVLNEIQAKEEKYMELDFYCGNILITPPSDIKLTIYKKGGYLVCNLPLRAIIKPGKYDCQENGMIIGLLQTKIYWMGFN